MSCNDDTDTDTDTTTRTTYCDRDRVNNCWIEGVVSETGEGGICLLDTMTEAQIVYTLQRDERARADLLRVTSDAYLLELANSVPRLPTAREGDVLQQQMNSNATSLPFYSQFRGRPPWNG